MISVSKNHLRKSLNSANNNLRKWMQLPHTDYIPPAYNGPDIETMKKLRTAHCNPGVYTYYKSPIAIVRGHMQYMYDQKGQRYLDGIAGICVTNVGHCHPKLVEAGKQQMETLIHSTTIYVNDQNALFLHQLAGHLPKRLSHIYLVNSGSEANDLAILNSRVYTGSNTVIGLRHAYHGMVGTSMDLTALGTWRYAVPNVSDIQQVIPPYLYRGPTNNVQFYINEVAQVIKTNTSGKVAAFIAESALGAGGYVFHPKGYLKGVYDIIRKAGGLCIADEVQTGFGRTGSMFNFTKQDVEPDMVVLAKAIGGGAPMAAVATTQEVAEVMKRQIHFNTYGGNPVSCAMGRAVLKILKEDQLVENAQKIGNFMLKELKKLETKYEFVGEVRGEGLMLAVQFVKDKKTKEPDSVISTAILERSKDYGLLLGRAGLIPNIIRIAPPLCINIEDARFILEVLDTCLQEYMDGKLN